VKAAELRKAFENYAAVPGNRSVTIYRFALIMTVFAICTATVAYFVADNIEPAGSPAALQPIANSVPPQQPSPPPQLVPRESEPLPQQPVRTIPIERPEGESTGASSTGHGTSAGQQLKAVTKQPQCDRRACSRAYRSFDEATCTYQPGRGGPRRLCEK
jgi:hypothetical protein